MTYQLFTAFKYITPCLKNTLRNPYFTRNYAQLFMQGDIIAASQLGKSHKEGLGIKGLKKISSIYKLERNNFSGLPDTSRPFHVLGIETSCDDTAVAVVRSDGMILSNIIISQVQFEIMLR